MTRLSVCMRAPALKGMLAVVVLIALPLLPAQGQFDPPKREILPLGEQDRERLAEQRTWVADLARRNVGSPTGDGSLDDLRILQELLDGGVVRRDQVWELQAMGVVLGDVMVRNLGLHWVVLEDQYGRSRALGGGKRDELAFPITMISKRVIAGTPVDVRSLYDSIAQPAQQGPCLTC